MIEVKPDYNSVNTIFKMLGSLKDLGNNIGIDLLRRSAQDYVNAVKSNIDTQEFRDFGKPMSAKWKQMKVKTMPDTANMFWKWLGTLYNNIDFKEISNGRYRVFVKSTQTAHGNPAYYGSVNEALRPLFQKSFIKFKPEWNKNCEDYFVRIRKASGTIGW
jgi:hypothetical protein